jgi:hypothetical protein
MYCHRHKRKYLLLLFTEVGCWQQLEFNKNEIINELFLIV